MYVVLTIFIITILLMILAIMFKPSLKIYKFSCQSFWVVTLLGAILIVLFSGIDIKEILTSMTTGKMNPIKILILFISLSMISISLDELNFFNFLAVKLINKTSGSQYKIFFAIYLMVSLLTIFTSNDIVILTFTPFICLFSRKAKINPIPYLIAEFVNANTYSMLFIIGNPTNIYLASSFDITFTSYLAKMWLPTILAGISTLVVILLLFKKDLSKKIDAIQIDDVSLKNKSLVIINLIILSITTILLVISNYINLEMWAICLTSLIILSVILTIYSINLKDKTYITNVYKRLPYNLIPFILSMFILVLSLKEKGVTEILSNELSSISTNIVSEAFTYSLSSTISANLINNIPMSVLFSNLVTNSSEIAIFASIIGSNIGAYLTPIGALAGIMWMTILKKHNINFSFMTFVKYGLLLVAVSLISATLGLIILSI